MGSRYIDDAYYAMVDACESALPDLFPKDGPTTDSIGTTRHGLEMSPRSLSRLLDWAIVNPNEAQELIKELRPEVSNG